MRGFNGVFWLLVTLFTSLGFVSSATPQTPGKPGFVTSSGKTFTLDGKPFRYIGTNAYWLQLLNKQDLNKTLHDIAAIGVKVVRTWAFNDVTEIPKDGGVWFQAFHKNGTIEINTGENGLGRLDNIVQAAKDNKLHVVFSLTNNWFRGAGGNKTKEDGKRGNSTNTPVNRRRGSLSNDYGGMDVYNTHFSKARHDEFYTNGTIVDAYSRYIATIVKRYANEPVVLGWELANDPRCSSGLPTSGSCNARTITRWTATVAQVVKENDPNHLLSVGDGGFYCVGCPKLFPFTQTVTNTQTATATNTQFVINTLSATNTLTVTNTQDVTNTLTATATNTQIVTDTLTATNTLTVTNTQDVTNTLTATNTQTVTNTETATNTQTVTNTQTATTTQTLTSTETTTSTETVTSTLVETESTTTTLNETSTHHETETETSHTTETETIHTTSTHIEVTTVYTGYGDDRTHPNKTTKPPPKIDHPPETCNGESCHKEDRRRGYLTEADVRKLFAKRAERRRLSVRQSQSGRCTPGDTAYNPDHKPDHKSDHKPDHKPDYEHQSNALGPTFDGSFGVDTEDLINTPGIDFSTLQYYPDQNPFGPDGGAIDLFDPLDIAQNGVDWVTLHSTTGNTFGAPIAVTAFGVLTDESLSRFVPFNPNDEGKEFATCTTQEDRAAILATVFSAAIKAGVNVQQYQWGQRNLTSTARGRVRRQGQVSLESSYEDGYEVYDDDPGRGSIAGAAYDMSGGEGGDYYEGGGTDDGEE